MRSVEVAMLPILALSAPIRFQEGDSLSVVGVISSHLRHTFSSIFVSSCFFFLRIHYRAPEGTEPM